MGVFRAKDDAKDVQPYAVVKDAGFQHKIKMLELCYNIPLTPTVIPVIDSMRHCQKIVQHNLCSSKSIM